MASQPYYTFTPDRPRVNPLLLLARRSIEESFEAARKCRDGEPTEDAVDAVRWIEESLDWTRLRRSDGTVPIPPKDIQAEFVLSFEYCCQLLDLDPAQVREGGLPATRLYSENSTQGGLPRIYRMWAEERAAWLAKQESESNLALEVPPATFVPEPLGTSDFN